MSNLRRRRRARANGLTTAGWVTIGVVVVGAGAAGWYFFLRDPTVTTVEQGKTYQVGGPLYTGAPTDATAFAASFVTGGWSNVSVTFLNGIGTAPTGAFLAALTKAGFSTTNGYVVTATRAGATSALTGAVAMPA